MLQQTQVKAVLPFFERWMERFPSPEALALATEDELLGQWQGLGYYRRARNLHSASRHVVAQGMPSSYREWLALPGIGRYTAAAIASIAQGERVAVVDGNVERVFARVTANESTGPTLTEEAREWAQGMLDGADSEPADFNQALMEMGACVCTPRNPTCSACPISDHCRAYAMNQADRYPVKAPKPTTVHLNRHGVAYIIRDALALIQIPKGEWWEGMWTLPWSDEPPVGERLGEVKQAVTKHRITFHIWLSAVQPEGSQLFAMNSLPPLPALQRKAISLIYRVRGDIPS